jgi:hypothetical protein
MFFFLGWECYWTITKRFLRSSTVAKFWVMTNGTIVFQGLLQEAANRVGKAPPEETIAFFFDWKMKKGLAHDLFDHAKQDDRLQNWRNRLGTLTFGHKEFDVPGSIPLLQCADIAALETRKSIGNPITHPHIPERKSLARLKEAGKVWSILGIDKLALNAMREDKRRELGLPNTAEETFPELHRIRSAGKTEG